MYNRITFMILAAIASLSAGAASARASECDAPVAKLQIATPAASLPKPAADFSGIWQGQWPVAAKQHLVPLCAKLYVSVTSAQTAMVEQCMGSEKEAKLKPLCKNYSAQIEGDTLSFTDLDGTVFSFTLADVGGILAQSVSAEHRSVTNFIKAE